MSGYFGPGETGLLALAQTLVGMPISVLVTSSSQVYVAEAATMARTDRTGQMPLFWHTIKNIAAITSILLFLTVVGLSFVVPFLFGNVWSGVVSYIQLLSPAYFIMGVGSPVFSALDVLERQDLHLVREFLRIPLMIGPIILGGGIGMDARACLMFYSAGTFIFYLVGILISWLAIHSAIEMLPS
jgi:O-antigen/teichoic acid export membrane protein